MLATSSRTSKDDRGYQFECDLVRGLIRRAEIAREKPAEFFSFVMREETTKARLIAAPHQRLLYDFVMHHDRCVVRMPVGTSKTFSMLALLLWLLGNDPTQRGAIISSVVDQARKTLLAARDMIENKDGVFPELGLVFPNLRKSRKPSDPWNKDAITIDRPPAIRDPSVVAAGMDSPLDGSRKSWILLDDLLSRKNAATVESRKKVLDWVLQTVLSRKDVQAGAKIVVTNTPWDDDDLTHALEKSGWPTITMDILGGVELTNCDDFDSPEIRPAYQVEGRGFHRLSAHDSAEYGAPLAIGKGSSVKPAHEQAHLSGFKPYRFDIEEVIPLWPERYNDRVIDDLRDTYRAEMHIFNQLYMCRVMSDRNSRCKVAWINKCKELAQSEGVFDFLPSYEGPNLVVTGIDLAVGKGRSNHKTSFFTYLVRPDNKRQIIDIETGKFTGPEIIEIIKRKHKLFRSFIRVETNAAQKFIHQFALAEDAGLPIKAHHTGENKYHPTFGVEAIFTTIANGAWLIPCKPDGSVRPEVQAFIDDCIRYKPPPAHTGDVLMSAWLATEEHRRFSKA